MNTVFAATLAAGPLVAGWSAHFTWLRRRLVTARRDPLTGLWTRPPFEEQAGRMAERGGVSVVFIDLDGFKQINDTHGHAAGDAVIRQAGARLDGWMQVHGPGVAARLGGDEFAAAVRALSIDELVWSAGQLQDALCEPIAYNGQAVTVGASVGAVWSPRGAVAPLSVLLRRADEAMYAAKRGGGGVLVTDDPATARGSVNGRRPGRRGTSTGAPS
jgi:diguanylate cyclase (GGDEF)-like protein